MKCTETHDELAPAEEGVQELGGSEEGQGEVFQEDNSGVPKSRCLEEGRQPRELISRLALLPAIGSLV